MAAAIQDKHGDAQLELKPGGRGDFIVIADGNTLWDKRRMGDEFPEHDAILAKL